MTKQQKATQLHDATIDFVSIVDKGANQRGFRILKAEDMDEAQTVSIGDRLKNLVTTGATEQAQVSAIICTPDEAAFAKEFLPTIGLAVDSVDETKDVVVFKQESFDADAPGTMIALNENVLVAFDRVIKGFHSFPDSTDFNENLIAGTFFPGVRAAIEILGETIFTIMFESEENSDANGMVSSALDAFSAHVRGLVSNLPVTVFKMDALGFNNQEHVMSSLAEKLAKGDTQINESMAGDLDGLMDEPVLKTEVVAEEVKPVEGEVSETPAAESAESEIVKEEVSEESADSAETSEEVQKEEGAEDSAEASESEATEEVAKEETESASKDDAIVAALQGILKGVETVIAKTEEIGKRIDAVEADSKEAVAKANRPVVVNNNIESEQLATINGHKPVQKHDAGADESVWGNLMESLDDFGSR